MTGPIRRALAVALCALVSGAPAYAQSFFSHAVIRIPEVRSDTAWVQVIATREEWEAFYLEHAGVANAAPPVDFSTYRIVAGGIGIVAAGGAQLAVERVYELSNTVLVQGVVVRPGSNCLVAQMVSWPSTAILIPQSDKPVSISMPTVVHDCPS
jgi:hypothetical protein